MADGSVVIDTALDASGLETGAKEIFASLKRTAKTIQSIGNTAESTAKALSGSFAAASDASDNLEKHISTTSDALKDLEGKEIEIKIYGAETSNLESTGGAIRAPEAVDPRYMGYDSKAIAFVNAYEKELEKAENKTNEFVELFGKMKAELESLEQSGKWFGDDEYDNAVLQLEKVKQAVRDYKNELLSPTPDAPSFGLDTYEGKIAAIVKQLDRLRNAGKGLGNQEYDEVYRKLALMKQEAKAYAAELAKTPAQMQKEAAKIDAVNQKLEESRAKEVQAAMESARLKDIGKNAEISRPDIVELGKELERLKVRQKELQSAGVGIGFSEFDGNAQRISEINAQLASYKKALNTTSKESGKSLGFLRRSFDKVVSSAKKAGSSMTAFVGKPVQSAIKKTTSMVSGVAKQATKAGMSFKKLIGYGLGIASMFSLFGKLRSVIQEGLGNLSKYSGNVKSSISGMQTSLSQLKNSFAAAFAPILTAVAPILTKFINMISQAVTYIGMLIASLTGQKTFTKASAAMEGYADAAGGAAKATDKAAKSAKNALAPFDKLNVIGNQKDSGGGGGGGTKGADMFETVEIPSSFDKFKNILADIFRPFKEAWSKEGKSTIDAVKSAFTNIKILLSDIGKSFMEVWTNGSGTAVLVNILQILQNIFDFIGNIAERIDEAWNKNNAGTQIIQHLFNLLNIILGTINNITAATAEWASKLDFSPLLESVNTLLAALEPLAQNIGAGLEWFWNNVLLPIAGWTIQEAVPTFLNMLAAAIGVVNKVIEVLKPLGLWLWDSFLQPLGQWAGTVVIAAMQTITNLLTQFGNWISEHQQTVENFVIVIGSFAAAWGIVTAAVTIWNAVCGIATTVAYGLGAAVAFLTSPIALVVAAIAVVIAIGVTLYKNWDKIKEKAALLGECIKKIWNGIKEKTSEVWSGIKEKLSAVWEGLKGAATGAFGAIGGTVKKVWNAIKSVTTSVWNGIGDAIKGVINGIIGFINGMISGVVSGINAIGKALNKLSFDVPDWIPGFGGKKFGFNIKEMKAPQIPYLAKGAVIPGGSPFLAYLGDQPRGKTNVEAPLDTIKQAVAEVMQQYGGGQYTFVAQLNGKEIFREVVRQDQMRRKASTKSKFAY